MPAKKIASAVHKGGSGKTTTTVSLAAALALEKKRVLVVDLDPQGNATQAFGFNVDDTTPSLVSVFERPAKATLRDVIVPVEGIPGLFLVPNDIRMEKVAQAHMVTTRRHEMLANALAPIESEFDYILMDCPPSLGLLTEWAVLASDFILIPLKFGDAHALHALRAILEFIGIVRADAGFRDWRILLTQLNRTRKQTNETFANALEDFKGQILDTVIPQHEPLNQSQFVSESIFSYDASGKGALAYQELAQELHGHGL